MRTMRTYNDNYDDDNSNNIIVERKQTAHACLLLLYERGIQVNCVGVL